MFQASTQTLKRDTMRQNDRNASVNPLHPVPVSEDVLMRLVNASQVELSANPANELNREKATTPINTTGGFQEHWIDLSDAAFNADSGRGVIPLNNRGFGIIMPFQGNLAGAVLDFDFDGGGRAQTVLPGAQYYGHFSKVAIRRNASSVTSGLCRVLVLLRPDVDYKELPPSTAVGIATATASTVADGTGAVPTLSTEGASIAGKSFARVTLSAGAGQTITALTSVRVWCFDPTLARWCSGEAIHSGPFPTGVRDIVLSVDELGVPTGRLYYQPIGLVTSDTNGVTVRVTTWGN